MSGQDASAPSDAIDSAAERRVFVYGTLRRASTHRMATFLAANARFVGEGTARGVLVNLGSYPALSLPGETVVLGDLYEFSPETMGEGIARLDAYEGCGPSDPQPHEYRKGMIDVTLDDGRVLPSSVYLLSGSPDRFERIESGDYLGWQESRSR